MEKLIGYMMDLKQMRTGYECLRMEELLMILRE